jgi:hypothetical protein
MPFWGGEMKYRIPLLLVVFLSGTIFQNIALADVRTNIIKDVYVLPVAELASTKTYPEIVEAENDYLKVEVLPNRGRAIASLIDKTTNLSFFYNNHKPEPMILPGGLHSVEFGGYYLSLPWNSRDRQPFDLLFEIAQTDPQSATVYLSGKDMFKKTQTECWIRLADKSPFLEMEVKITNTSGKTSVKTAFKDFKIFSTAADDISLLLPVDSFEIVNNKDEWLGQAGTAVVYADAVKNWGGVKAYVNLQSKEELKVPAVAMFYPAHSAALVSFWEPEPFFNKIEVWSWGKNYQTEEGADAYFAVSSIKDELSLQPKESVSFKIYFVPLSGVSTEDTITSLYEKARSYLR